MLLAIEGVHGAGKSTLIDKMHLRLSQDGLAVYVTRWNSDPLLAPAHARLRDGGCLRAAHTFVAFEAADLALRLPTWRDQARRNDSIVIADRYVFSVIARASVRGLSRDVARAICSFAPEPDLYVLLDASGDVVVQRKMPVQDRHWRGGFGFTPSAETVDQPAYRRYQQLLGDELRDLVTDAGGAIVDAVQPATDVLDDVLAAVRNSRFPPAR